MAKHTEGEWRVEEVPGYYIIRCGDHPHGGVGIAKVAGGKTTEENKMNANLIAAAPDLLAACEAAIAEQGTREHANPCSSSMDEQCDCWLGRLRAATAKARGK